MKFETITIKDIAKALGLSTSTVSRALRGGYEISEETKKIVLEYAAKINYKPNPIALSLKERRSHTIGIIVCEFANTFFSQAINGIESIAYNAGYNVIITQSNESYEREIVNIQHLASRSVDGLLISLSSETSDVSLLKSLYEKGLPIVFFDRISDEIQTHKVTANNFKGGFDATEYLISLGNKRIAHITNSAHLSITRERLKGYKAALEKNNIPFDERYLKYSVYGGRNQNELEQIVADLIALPEKPDALFIAQDKLSTGSLLALKKLAPEYANTLKIVGFTNSGVVDLFSPEITAVRQPAFEIGQQATQMLINLIESKYPITEFQTKVLDTELILKS
jgi:LacI family transcriptional regulator